MKSIFTVVLLFGISQALYLNEHQYVDMTSQILSTNNGSMEMLIEGDILVANTKNARVCPGNNCFWPRTSTGLVEVPYVISAEFSSSDRSVIADAMNTFHSRTCIKFVLRSSQNDYISIENRDGCYSSVGRTGGAQVVSLNRNGCIYKGIVQHEINHSLGFYHEHTRSDRDNYVVINWSNIDRAMQSNFNKENTNNLNTPYDYSSVMHYGKTAFSINGLPTITPIPNPNVAIGQRVDMSNIDIQRIKALYNC